MSSIRSRACGFSILASRAARPPISPRASIRSAGFWTKDRATKSTPSSRPKARSSRSLAVSGERSSAVSGRLTPLRLLIVPPTTTLASIASASSETASSRTRPSSISSAAPGRIALKISGCGSGIASLPPSSRPSTKRTRLAGRDLDLAVLDQADPDLGALQVLQNGDRAAGLALERTDRGVDLAVVVMRSMAEVQPEHVGSGQEQLAQPLRRRAGRPDGRNDLGVTMTAHGMELLSLRPRPARSGRRGSR